ncbi:MAG: peptide chain release factor 1 [Flavobacteriales bacterium]|jgi:peptide chain release factor 1|uniref:peptide chain release factor 1 n=1 Tax=Blattabacterium sp. (Mastotermes darwiniensis) TaxID=39768 RepID=UPI000231DDF5|nr:peptide chain release factor 1 [Blattabacterium sp. (Mastotermes darwiniensis)]AER40553.1 peptide chain release factor 1 [Blattabacterium sp. (Mastotermes darwiniensis) str. MADAR]MDR1805050.1 peptide chain release factor 1 [Flavobacteriales bacterium]
MKRSSLLNQFEVLEKKFHEISNFILKPLSNQKKYKILFKEYQKLKKIMSLYERYKNKLFSLQEAKNVLENDSDPEMKEIASLEKKKILEDLSSIEKESYNFLLSDSITEVEEDHRNAIVELRSGTGGYEACLFVEDILRMYIMYFKQVGWKYEILHSQKGGIKGYKEIILEVSGNDVKKKGGVYSNLKLESGVHRVQRIPRTESQGRIHTSAITVAVLPEIKSVEMNIDLSDIKKETFRSSGAGGQHVNKTESAVRLTHITSKITVECQEERSQHKNFEKAMKVLRSRIYKNEMEKRIKERSIKRKSLISTGDRSVKIRTYNYPKSRVTDHRIHKSIYDIVGFMNGNIQEMIDLLKIFEEKNKKNQQLEL